MRNYKLIILLTVISLACRVPHSNGFFIDLSDLNNKALPLKVVLSEFRFNSNSTSWDWVKLDSMVIQKYNSKELLKWKKKYDHPFIAEFKMFNAEGIIVEDSQAFILSDSQLLAKKDPSVKPINIQNQYENAVTFEIIGGENSLYANKDFLSAPHIRGAGNFLSRITNKKNLIPDGTPIFAAWNNYERGVIDSVKKYSDDYYTLFRLIAICDRVSAETLEKCLLVLDERLKNTNEGKFLTNYYVNSTHLFIGSPLPTFQIEAGSKQQDSKKIIAKGRYYFIDFWASWCMPCRQQMQEIKPIYPSVDTNKMQFVSLSLDESADVWTKASNAEQLKWLNFLGVNKQGENLRQVFGLRYIPQNFLIDPNGLIIGKNISPNELKTILETHHLQKYTEAVLHKEGHGLP